MKKPNKIVALIQKGARFAEEHQREIMLGGAIAGTIITAVTAWKAGIKADKIIASYKEQLSDLESEGLNEDEFKERKKDITWNTMKQLAPVVAPPVVAASGTIVSVVGGYKVASTQIATLSALYNMSEKALTEYQDKAKDLFGEKKAIELKDAVNEEKVKANPPINDIIHTGHGNVLCYDAYSGRYFYSSPEFIKKVFNELNMRLMSEYYISLNELYSDLELKPIKLGSDIGFALDDGLIDIDDLFTVIKTDDDMPCLVLDFDVSPKYGFGDFSGRFGR